MTSTENTLDTLQPGVALNEGRFIVTQLLGRGGFGVTYQAHDTQVHGTGQPQHVAVKELFPEGCLRVGEDVHFPASMNDAAQVKACEGFLNEARLLSAFHHPGIVRVEGTFQENNTAYLVMEFLNGPTLEELVAQRGPLPESLALSLIEQIGAALIEVHRAHFIHRDIKPDNVIVCTKGSHADISSKDRVVLLDFGLNKELAPVNTYHTLRLTDALRFGSSGYSPPEQYGRQAKFGPYTDLYALGATLYYLLSGRVPPEAPARMAGEDLTPLRSFQKVSAQVEEAVIWALQLKGDERPQDVEQFLSSLQDRRVASSVQAATVTNAAGTNTTTSPSSPQTSPQSLPQKASQTAPASPTPHIARQSTHSSRGNSRKSSQSPSTGGILTSVKTRTASFVVRTGKRALRHVWGNFLEILPRLLLVVALIMLLFLWAKPQQNRTSGKPGSASKKQHKKQQKQAVPQKPARRL